MLTSVIILTNMLSTKNSSVSQLSILALSIGISMEDNIIRQIILISGIVVFCLSVIDAETGILFNLSIIGLLVLATAQELIIIYLAIELVSLSFYILAARERKGQKSTEAGIKYFILGALSSGILLLGITIIYAKTGTTSLETLMIDETSYILIVVAFLFKLGAAPFHMWVPDVYEGSPTIITTYFAIVPKIAYMSVLMKIEMGEEMLIAGILSIFVGSFAAINQTKIKRLLAYSAIAHVGFMLLGIGIGTFSGIHATIVYMIIYIILTINSFSIVLSQKWNYIAEARGISRHNPILAITFGLGLMSIAGVPPLAGFFNKYLIILSTIEQSEYLYAMIAIILSVISSFYYVRIIRYMFFVDNPELTVQPVKVSPSIAIILGISTYFLLSLLIFPSLLLDISIL